MTTPLTLNTTRGDDGHIALIAVGEIDQSNIDEFSQALATATTEAAGSGETLTVDLSAVEYLDSAAINALYASTDHIKLIANPLLTRILTVSGLSELTTIDLPPST
ncbi:MAG TPA: STAS domain-containing protein [Mycobacterium sp.]|nr:STAS domain-containing protein [Mycobacterium sp.]